MAKKNVVKLGDSKKTITFDLGDRGTFEVPLPNSLPLTTMQSLWEAQKVEDDGTTALNWSIDFFRQYLGDTVDSLTLEEYVTLSQAWQQAGEAELGESLA